jgi:undecaprenyl-diphosphatase
LLSGGAVEGRLAWLDAPVARSVEALRSPLWTRGMLLVSWLGHGSVLTAWVVAAVVWLYRLRARHLIGYLVLTSAGAGLLNLLLKLSFARPRPALWSRLAAASGYSFPSGHAMASAAVYVALAMVVAASRPSARAAVAVVAGVLVVAIGVSRVYLGVHYPSDVLAGWILGVIWAVAMYPTRTSVSASGHSE